MQHPFLSCEQSEKKGSSVARSVWLCGLPVSVQWEQQHPARLAYRKVHFLKLQALLQAANHQYPYNPDSLQ
eukprot:1143257-Pleurochrysis_carterae.AAC.1